MNSKGRSPVALDMGILTLALSGFAINLLLLVKRYSDAAVGIAGCGGGSCDEVLGSRWSAIFGLPVTGFGLLAYAGLMISLAPRWRGLGAPVCGMIAGAAAWFIFAQFVLIGRICVWCMAAHVVGIGVVTLGLLRFRDLKSGCLWSVTAFLGIGLVQIYGPVPATHRIEDLSASRSPVSAATPGSGRKAVFDDGRKSFDVTTLPRLGPADAEHVMVEYFDYHCAACRMMADYLGALTAKHPAKVAVLLLPVPLDGTCNPHASPAIQHAGSCETTRIALAVWRVKPDDFSAFHRALIHDPSPASAGRLALALMTPEQLASARSDPWIDTTIQTGIAGWRTLSKSNDRLPKLLIRDKRILHGPPSGEADFIRVMEKELGL